MQCNDPRCPDCNAKAMRITANILGKDCISASRLSGPVLGWPDAERTDEQALDEVSRVIGRAEPAPRINLCGGPLPESDIIEFEKFRAMYRARCVRRAERPGQQKSSVTPDMETLNCNQDAKPAFTAAPCYASHAEHVRSVMGSSKDMTWPTPKEWFDYLNLEFGFTLDPCCEHETAKCAKHYTPAEDGLAQSWKDERVFMNPPYGREIGPWMRKAYEEARDNGALVVCFVPARVDTEWWHRYAAKATEVRYPKGRVKNPDGGAWPFPIAVVIYRPRL